MASLGCGGLYLFLWLVARRLIHYRLRERVYIHASMIGQSHYLKQRKGCAISNLTTTHE